MWHGRAFGLELVGGFHAAGLLDAREGRGPATTSMRLAAPDAVGRAAGEMLHRQSFAEGSFAIARGDDGFYRVDHPYYGRYSVAGDGSQILCAPAALADWIWQRFLVGQALPLASLLSGHETLHASAVVVDGAARVVMGASGAGKTSVALHMAARGARLLADDVVALRMNGASVLAHPGPALVSLDTAQVRALPAPLRKSARAVGTFEGETRLVLDAVAHEPVPVAALYVLTRSDGAGRVVLEPAGARARTIVLGGTFNAYLRDPDRLARQLEIAARLAEEVSIQVVTIPSGANAATVAETILHAP